MSGRPAAILGSKLDHGGSLAGGGSQNVKARGRPMWRVDDLIPCPLHAGERVVGGSENVKINGRRALRVGDFAIGYGGPNRIQSGCSTVFIGSLAPSEGLASPASLAAFCKEYCALKADWSKLTPKEREARMKAIIGHRFESFGAPPPKMTTTAGKEADGSFSPAEWSLNFPPGAFDGDSPPGGDVVLHECRHGEQQFAPMREAAARGASPSELSEDSGVPDYVAQQASRNPLPSDSAYGRWAQTMGSENMTEAGKQREHRVIREYNAAFKKYGPGREADEAYEPYRKLPNGQDAHDIEDAAKCDGCP